MLHCNIHKKPFNYRIHGLGRRDSTTAVLDLLPQVSDERSTEVIVKLEKPRIVP